MSYWTDPGAWGELSGWASASVSTVALVVAVMVYRRDSNLRRDAQAKKIHASLKDEINFTDPTVHIFNYSDQRIFNVGVETQPFEFYEWALDTYEIEGKPPTEAELVQLEREISQQPSLLRRTNDDLWTIDPGGEKTYKLELVTPASYQRISASFTDSNGRRWRLTNVRGAQPRLEFVEDDPMYPSVMRWRHVRHPIQFVGYLLAGKKIKGFQQDREKQRKRQYVARLRKEKYEKNWRPPETSR